MGLLIWNRRWREIKRKKAPLIVQRDNLVVSLTTEATPLQTTSFHGQFHIYGRCACEQVSNWNLQAAVTLAAIIVRMLVLYIFFCSFTEIVKFDLASVFCHSCKCFFWEQLSWSAFLRLWTLQTNRECWPQEISRKLQNKHVQYKLIDLNDSIEIPFCSDRITEEKDLNNYESF